MPIQNIEGITNEVIGEEDKFYIFWDIENCALEQAVETLLDVQYRHQLADIFITSDKDSSYRAFCFSKRSFNEYMITLHNTKYVDYSFIWWTYKRHKSTLRTSGKAGRPLQDVVAFLRGYEPYELPSKIVRANYETGLEKYPKPKVVKLFGKRNR
jgi:hypothetical protein